jgi:hypothetical protein
MVLQDKEIMVVMLLGGDRITGAAAAAVAALGPLAVL